ncbi:MAG: 50S ribosomal protein L24 [Patescibacteria group bacterium]
MRIKKGDNVKMLSGKDRGKTGAVLRAFPDRDKVVVDGLNIRKRHVRARKSGQKGEVVQFPAPVPVSNVQMLCGKCGKPARLGYQIIGDHKSRVCKKCGAML